MKMQNLSLQEIIEEALKLPLSDQERIATELSYLVLGEMQALGYEEQDRRPAR